MSFFVHLPFHSPTCILTEVGKRARSGTPTSSSFTLFSRHFLVRVSRLVNGTIAEHLLSPSTLTLPLSVLLLTPIVLYQIVRPEA